MSPDEGPMSRLAILISRGELSATAYLDVVDEHTEAWTERALLRLDEALTLCYREVALLLAASIGVVFLTALVVALS